MVEVVAQLYFNRISASSDQYGSFSTSVVSSNELRRVFDWFYFKYPGAHKQYKCAPDKALIVMFCIRYTCNDQISAIDNQFSYYVNGALSL